MLEKQLIFISVVFFIGTDYSVYVSVVASPSVVYSYPLSIKPVHDDSVVFRYETCELSSQSANLHQEDRFCIPFTSISVNEVYNDYSNVLLTK